MSIRAVQGVGHGEAFVPVKDAEDAVVDSVPGHQPFDVGDRVRLKPGFSSSVLRHGQIYTVSDMDQLCGVAGVYADGVFGSLNPDALELVEPAGLTYPNNPNIPSFDIKESNPKDAIGSRKVPFHLVPQQVVGEIALGMLEGACKYGAYNYRAIGVRSSVYHAAAKRHLGAWWEGQDIDPRSGLHHITKAIASLVVLRDAMIQGKCEDDRPPPVADPDWVEKLNAEAARILDEHPNPLPPYTIKGVR